MQVLIVMYVNLIGDFLRSVFHETHFRMHSLVPKSDYDVARCLPKNGSLHKMPQHPKLKDNLQVWIEQQRSIESTYLIYFCNTMTINYFFLLQQLNPQVS